MFDSQGNYVTGGNPNFEHSVLVIAALRDGIIFASSGARSDFCDSNNLLTNGGIIGGSIIVTLGAASSSRGDVFCIYNSNRVRVLNREYTNATNFKNPPAIPHLVILASSQRTGTNLIDIDYQVTDADSAVVSTGLLAVRGNGYELGDFIPLRTFVEGTADHVGASQPTGVLRHVTWNMPADWAVDYGTVQIEALAKDERNLLPIHWITVPASGGQPAFQASSAPVTNTMLRDLWSWCMALGQSVTATYTNGGSYGWLAALKGTTGAYTNALLVQDQPWLGGNAFPATNAGRLFASEQLGARPITVEELARASAGKFGFSSLSTESIVKTPAAVPSYLKSWGLNNYGQSGWQFFSPPNISSVAAGGECTFVLKADGVLFGVGSNGNGGLGIGSTTSPGGFVQVSTGVAKVATSGFHTLFVKMDGTLWATGLNDSGQLGDGTATNHSTPVQIASGVSQVAAGYRHSLFSKADGTLWAMGSNASGQLGDGTATSRSTPVQIASDVSQVAAGAHHSLFVKTDATLWGMGHNGSGQLGDGTSGNTRPSPIQIATGVQQAAGGGDSNGFNGFSVFLKTDGSLWGMGWNARGPLGDGTYTNRSSSVQIASGVTQVVAGYLHTVFLKTDGSAWATGCNSSGQIADGTTNDRNTPLQFHTGVAGIAAGAYHTVVFTVP